MKQYIQTNKKLIIIVLGIVVIVAGAADLLFKGLLYEALITIFN